MQKCVTQPTLIKSWENLDHVNAFTAGHHVLHTCSFHMHSHHACHILSVNHCWFNLSMKWVADVPGCWQKNNKANLRDLIVATGLIILLKLDSNSQFSSPCDLEVWSMTSKNNTAPLYTTSSFVHHFKSIGEFKLDLQSGNPQFGSKLPIFCPAWPLNLADDFGKQ